MLDLKIENARIITGDGSPAFEGSVAVAGERVVEIAPRIDGEAAQRVDAAGRVVCPGFIDLHTHSTASPSLNLVRQGCTLLVGGLCGFSTTDLPELIRTFEADPPAHNLAMFIGHNTVRSAVMGNEDRRPTDEETAAMRDLVRKAMEAGAVGLSAGLAYAPGCFSETEEVIELAKVAAAFGGFYDPHQRDETDRHRESDDETLRIGREAGLPVHISHYKVNGIHNAGQGEALLAELDAAREAGLDVTVDQYPYTASCGRITLLFPKWACEGSYEDVLRRIETPDTRARIKGHIVNHHRTCLAGDSSRVVISTIPVQKECEGKSVGEIAEERGRAPDADGFAETVMELACPGGSHVGTDRKTLVMCVYHQMSEVDVERIMRWPHAMIGSDAWGIPFGHGHPHPRLYGTFPRVLGGYCRKRGLFPLEEAVHKMTGMSARRLGLTDRGTLRAGAVADLTIFDADAVEDRATFDAPHQYPEGVDYVIVNGQAVIADGEETGATPGRFLKRPV